MVIGLEFVSGDGGATIALLGHRSVCEEHDIEMEVEEGGKVGRLKVEGQHEVGGGLERIKVS